MKKSTKPILLGILFCSFFSFVFSRKLFLSEREIQAEEEGFSYDQISTPDDNSTSTDDNSTSSSNSLSSVRVNSRELHLSGRFKITSKPRTRNYIFEITNQTAALDGYERPVLVINNQFPGPLIEANDGDTLHILVKNKINLPVSIHWHGIWQNGTPWMDGVTGVTQCPIPAGTEFTYSFKINGQFGTFWYHAHAQNLAADGILGPLIIHSPNDPLKRGVDYDNDIVLVVNDWYHNMSTTILEGQLSAAGYQGSLAAPSPNSALFNGIGYFNCSLSEHGSNCKQQNQILELRVSENEKTRIRLIGAGTHALFRFSADNHPLKVIEADATGVNGPAGVHRLPFHNGQRYSVILDTSNDTVGTSFALRAVMDTDCFAWVAPGLTERAGTAMAIVRVVPKHEKRRCGCSTTELSLNATDWKDSIGGPCLDINEDLTPLIAQSVPETVLGKRVVNTSFGVLLQPNSKNRSQTESLGRFFVNSTTWKTYTYKPLLPQMINGGQGILNQSEVAAYTLESLGWYDIIIQNLDKAIDHSYHLHGVDSHIIARGNGTFDGNSNSNQNLKYNLVNPTRRDTYVIGGGTFAIIRVYANNPGVWILHCHIGWHLAAGFAGVFVMQPNLLSTYQEPELNRNLCKNGLQSSNQNETEPG
ncbi:multi-copper oxidase laccase-like protein [Melampsora larici-populina 98AG31]|uniref:Multi-copper oxidase laccase-like protein n=1 Tax=Melampsora larici-populina (strain 98AG31 / pathotype 3-4-7) TaxID=747676 RepID=F4S2L7_MELLP|nr:multi-copper oxidase laccase-like protein [Melampsora larici-populina 98AG31]EGG01109.1 multi-copper oxidase laccase-like protein [Melampsora larici-populina 98AG31]